MDQRTPRYDLIPRKNVETFWVDLKENTEGFVVEMRREDRFSVVYIRIKK